MSILTSLIPRVETSTQIAIIDISVLANTMPYLLERQELEEIASAIVCLHEEYGAEIGEKPEISFKKFARISGFISYEVMLDRMNESNSIKKLFAMSEEEFDLMSDLEIFNLLDEEFELRVNPIDMDNDE